MIVLNVWHVFQWLQEWKDERKSLLLLVTFSMFKINCQTCEVSCQYFAWIIKHNKIEAFGFLPPTTHFNQSRVIGFLSVGILQFQNYNIIPGLDHFGSKIIILVAPVGDMESTALYDVMYHVCLKSLSVVAILFIFITARHIVREGNVFTCVCLSICPTGGRSHVNFAHDALGHSIVVYKSIMG